MTNVPVLLFAAVNSAGYIGKNQSLMYTIPGDMQFFMSSTINCMMVMGRKTWESLPEQGKIRNEREVMVLSKIGIQHFSEGDLVGTYVHLSSFQIIDLAKKLASERFLSPKNPRVAICGGESVYEEFFPFVDSCILTKIFDNKVGDARFPIDYFGEHFEEHWLLESDEENGVDYEIWRYERKQVESEKSDLLWDFPGDREQTIKGDRIITAPNNEMAFRLSRIDAFRLLRQTPCVRLYMSNGEVFDFRFENEKQSSAAYAQLGNMLVDLIQS